MSKKGAIQHPQDILAGVVIIFGGIGFLLWGLGIALPSNVTLQWLGGSVVALVAFLATFLSRWFK